MNQRRGQLRLLSDFNEICSELTYWRKRLRELPKELKNVKDEQNWLNPINDVIQGLNKDLGISRALCRNAGVEEEELDNIINFWKGLRERQP